MEFESYHIYKVPGTQRYVQIDNSGLCAKTLSGDSGDKTSNFVPITYVTALLFLRVML